MSSDALSIHVESDWVCSTGRGVHNDVDVLVARDEAGLPTIPAKTVRGLWRDACEQAAFALNGGSSTGCWSTLVKSVFEGPVAPGAARQVSPLFVRSARLNRATRQALAAFPEQSGHNTSGSAALTNEQRGVIRDGLTVTRHRVALHESRGVALDDTKREIEMARGNMCLTAGFEWTSGDMPEVVELLLRSALPLFTRLGLGRRRGGGRCEVKWGENSARVQQLLNALRERPLDESCEAYIGSLTHTPEAMGRVPDDNSCEKRRGDGALSSPFQTAARIRFTTTEPLLTGGKTLGNTVRGADYVRGATLLPLIASHLSGAIRRYVREGRLIITDANPVVHGRRATPAPLSVVSPKGPEHWEHTGEAFHAFDSSDVLPHYKPVRGWGVMSDGVLWLGEPQRSTSMHAVIDDATQRPSDNGVYVYESLAVGTVLECDLLHDGCLSQQDIDSLVKSLKKAGTVVLGRSRSSGFGGAQVEVSVHNDTQRSLGQATLFDLVCTSDVHLVDVFGQDCATATELASQVSNLIDGVELDVVHARQKVVRRESWSGKVGLPRRSMVCLSAGTVVRVSTASPLSLDGVAELLRGGVGLGHVEGLGRVDVRPTSPKTTRRFAVRRASHHALPEGEASAVLDESGVPADVLSVIWYEEICRRLADVMVSSQVLAALLPEGVSRSQLGTLRTAVLRADTQLTSVRGWISATRAASNRAAQWGETALDELESWCEAHSSAGAVREKLLELPSKAVFSVLPEDLGGAKAHAVVRAVLLQAIKAKTMMSQVLDVREAALDHVSQEA